MNTSTNAAPMRMWLAHPIGADVAAALDRLARTDDAVRVAVMPDVHLAGEVCVGAVLATSRLIYPDAVGGDIGCGIAAIAFDAAADALSTSTVAARILGNLSRTAPAMRHASRGAAPALSRDLDAVPLSDARLESIRRRDGAIQLGTLGRGNHFLEFQADEDDRLWLMVHSGSRAVGPAIRDFHLQFASKSATGLRWLDAQTPQGQAYLADMEWARRYARESRRAMVDAAAELVRLCLDARVIDGSYFDHDHNHVRRETHDGRALWVHRKGAAFADAGENGMIPGSMGTQSFHVEGRGCGESLCSSSHGAGRAKSRQEARRRISPRNLDRELAGVWYDHRVADALREEAPSAYKDIKAVMRAQRELTKTVRRLRPVLCYKAG